MKTIASSKLNSPLILQCKLLTKRRNNGPRLLQYINNLQLAVSGEYCRRPIVYSLAEAIIYRSNARDSVFVVVLNGTHVRGCRSRYIIPALSSPFSVVPLPNGIMRQVRRGRTKRAMQRLLKTSQNNTKYPSDKSANNTRLFLYTNIFIITCDNYYLP